MNYERPVHDDVLQAYFSKQPEPTKEATPTNITLYEWLDTVCKNGHELRIEKSKAMVRLRNKNTGDVFLAANPMSGGE